MGLQKIHEHEAFGGSHGRCLYCRLTSLSRSLQTILRINLDGTTQWQIRCAFNGFCKLALKREAMNAHRDTKQRQLREVTFSDLSPLEEKQLYVCDEYFADDEAEQSFVVGGKEITAKLLAEALHSLPEEKRETVLLYYFFDMSEREIAKFCNLSRTTVQSRRTSSMKLLKRYLEEKAYDCTD